MHHRTHVKYISVLWTVIELDHRQKEVRVLTNKPCDFLINQLSEGRLKTAAIHTEIKR